ncbi:hypothetical protein GCM10011414_27920 [Croceivirga lutea]|nr:hypothetical protein GCM10011414_27920 [Croceivirga lutea]
MVVNVTDAVTPTFDAAEICSDEQVDLGGLPTTSNNGITGTWSEDNGVFTFTPAEEECATTAELVVNVTDAVTPTFDAVEICSDEQVDLGGLPTTSNNGITGTWSEDNGVFTFTPAEEECATTAELVVNVTDAVTPTFDAAEICSDEQVDLGGLPTTSNNGITGTWSEDNGVFTFTPAEEECATTAELVVNVTDAVTPTFDAVEICSDEQVDLGGLPTTSNNGITGTWSEDNGVFTFTPAEEECATTTELVVNVTDAVTPTFDAVEICSDEQVDLGGLPTTSNNGITGTWSEDNGVFTFTPAEEECATSAELVVNVTDAVTPTFDAVEICSDEQVDLGGLPTTSNNGITGTWSEDNGVFTFTPAKEECATTAELVVNVTDAVTPTFDAVEICSDEQVDLGGLPTTSNNGITGTWSEDNGVFTFTPAEEECATTTELVVNVTDAVTPTFDAVEICSDEQVDLGGLPTTSNNGITGTWSEDNGVFTFTPAEEECATTAELVVNVTDAVTPTFDAVEICSDEQVDLGGLPTTSNNGITGTWSEDNGVFTFTPAEEECATTAELVLIITQKPNPAITEITLCYDDSYTWDENGETYYASNGNIKIVIEGENCTQDKILVINVPEIVSCNITQDALATNHLTADGVATVNPSGGTLPYTYVWDNGETTQTARSLTYGIHTVTVTDANGCESTCQIDIAKVLYCWTGLLKNVSEYGGNDGAAKVTGNGGYRPYTFKWDDGTVGDTNTSLTAGIHYVTITDATGATSRCNVTVEEPSKGNCDKFMVSAIQDELATNHLTADGVATVFPTGGSAPYTYIWDNGETTPTARKLTYGLHSVTVIDAKGCESTCQIDIAKILYCWTGLLKNVSEYGASDGAATVTGNGGYRPYTFKWDDGTNGDTNTNLTAGVHYVTITDASGATSQCSIEIYEPGQEVCDGVDNDGDGKTDEGFDADGDGIADCFDDCDDSKDSDHDGIPDCKDKCDQGDDTVDVDNDGIPDACDDDICIKPEMPVTACYETAEWNTDTCAWDITGEQPEKPEVSCYGEAIWNADTCEWDIVGDQPEVPVTACYETAVWNNDTCSWDITGEQPEKPEVSCYGEAIWNADTCEWDIVGDQPEMPVTACYETAVWNTDTCSWDVTGEQPEKPEVSCYGEAIWNADTCEWDIVGDQPEMPVTACYETAVWNNDTCSWDVTGEQPEMPEVSCYGEAVWNADTCEWDIVGDQPDMPVTACYETAVWNNDTCSWDVTGEQPEAPEVECYQEAIWNADTCSWDVIGDQPEMPVTACYETAVWNNATCSWDVTGEQPEAPEVECYQEAIWNADTCSWDITGDQPEMPELECYQEAEWNSSTCEWNISDNDDKSCAGGSIDKCETAFAKGINGTCFSEFDIPANRWGWTNAYPTQNGDYSMDLFAAAGQCNTANGALVGSVNVSYQDGVVSVSVSVYDDKYIMEEAQLYVGEESLPRNNGGQLTVAPGQYPQQDNLAGSFTSYTFDDVAVDQNVSSFYVIVHATVCPKSEQKQLSGIKLMAYPVRFKQELNLDIESSYQGKGNILFYDSNGRKIRDFGIHNLAKGSNSVKLYVGDVAAGMYYIQVNTGYENKSIKVVGE